MSEHPPAGTSAATKVSASIGIVAAVVLAVLVNALVARHYRRWDWSRGGVYSLSPATVQTLRGLEEPVRVVVLLSTADPLQGAVKQMLESYRAETSRLDVAYADPDRHPAEFIAIQQKYGLVAGRLEEDRVIGDTAIIVAKGDRPYFIAARDLVQVEDEEDLRARPRLEQALTAGIRTVTRGDKPRICFTSGHGEKASDSGGAEGLAPLRQKLVKDNFDVADLAPGPPDNDDPLARCTLLLVASPEERVPAVEITRWIHYLEGGGNALVVAAPQPDSDREVLDDEGLDPLLAAAGLTLDRDFVFERDPKRRRPEGFGESFMPLAKPHPITDGLGALEAAGVPVVLSVASSLSPASSFAGSPPQALLVTTDQAFGLVDFFKWAKNPNVPVPSDDDRKGPLTLAYAVELGKPAGSTAPHGPRVVVVSALNVLHGRNWVDEDFRGTALFVENAVSWATASPIVLDIPPKPTFTAGLRMTPDALASVFRYVVLFMPLAASLLGVAVWLRRRSGDRRRDPAEKDAA